MCALLSTNINRWLKLVCYCWCWCCYSCYRETWGLVCCIYIYMWKKVDAFWKVYSTGWSTLPISNSKPVVLSSNSIAVHIIRYRYTYITRHVTTATALGTPTGAVILEYLLDRVWPAALLYTTDSFCVHQLKLETNLQYCPAKSWVWWVGLRVNQRCCSSFVGSEIEVCQDAVWLVASYYHLLRINYTRISECGSLYSIQRPDYVIWLCFYRVPILWPSVQILAWTLITLSDISWSRYDWSMIVIWVWVMSLTTLRQKLESLYGR